jgi:hypothetical protein
MDGSEHKTYQQFEYFCRRVVKQQKEIFNIKDPSSWRNYLYDLGTSFFYNYIEPRWNRAVRIPYLMLTQGAYVLDIDTGDLTVHTVTSLVKPGDLIYGRSEASATTFLIELISNSVWTHVGIVDKTGEAVSVLEAVDYQGVVATPLKDYLKRYSEILVIRPKITEEQASFMIQWCRSCIGNSYDFTFSFKKQHSFYCSKFIWFALKSVDVYLKDPPNDIFGYPLLPPDSLLNDNLDKFDRVFEVHKFFYATPSDRKRGLLRLAWNSLKRKIRRRKTDHNDK